MKKETKSAMREGLVTLYGISTHLSVRLGGIVVLSGSEWIGHHTVTSWSCGCEFGGEKGLKGKNVVTLCASVCLFDDPRLHLGEVSNA